MKRVGILTGGGDCPGLNAVIRAVVRRIGPTATVLGFRNGWAGALEPDTVELTLDNTSGILHRGGTILGTSRTNPLKEESGLERVAGTLERHDVDLLIAIGGDDTLGVAHRLGEQGTRVVGVPKTIDNDLSRHRLHLWISDRGPDSHRCDRSAAHHGRVSQPRDGR